MKINEIVRLKNGMDGVIKSINKNKIKVNVRNSFIVVDKNDIIPTGIMKKGSSRITYNKQYASQKNIDLHGFTYDEALYELDLYFNEVINSNIKKFIIVHGKGEGKMRSAAKLIITRYVECISYSDYAPQNMGGMGATIVVLK